MRLTSLAFENRRAIPQRYSGEGENISPPLSWTDAPTTAKSFALICEDPDAPSGMFHHWAAYDIGRERVELPEAFPPEEAPDSVKQAVNDFGRHGYGGPMPPKGHGTHHYHFRLIACDTDRLNLGPEAKVQDVEKAALAHKIAETELIGLYER